ncbi:MAG TPA: 2-oxoacid:acceptor oxidoreductase family protein, partial [Ramlibacter sp.]
MDASLRSELRAGAGSPAVLETVSVAIAGSGGSGVMTAGEWLLVAAARSGLYGRMVRTSGPQIRGGEAAALLRMGAAQVESLDDAFDMLFAIDWQNVHRFADEIPLRAGGLLVCDADAGEVPPVFLATGARVLALPLKKMAKAIPGSWINMLALGVTGTLARLPVEALEEAVRAGWKRDAEVLQANLR